MPCEDWEPEEGPELPVTAVAVRASDIPVGTSPTGPTLRCPAGAELWLRVRPEVVYRIRAICDSVVLEVAAAEDFEMLRTRAAVDRREP